MSKTKADKEIYRSYHVDHFANGGKVKQVFDVQDVYRRAAKTISKVQWNLFYGDGGFDNMSDVIKFMDVGLSERYKQVCQRQVVANLSSFISNRKEDFTDMVYKSSLDDLTKLHLHYINKYNYWFNNEVKIPHFENGKRVKGEYDDVPVDTLKLARKMFKHLLKVNKRPKYNNINMDLSALVVKYVEKENDLATEFDCWLQFSTLVPHQTIMLPIKTNEYYDGIDGVRHNSYQFNKNQEGGLDIRFTKELQPVKLEFKNKQIALDLGLNTFVATSFGDLFGRTFYDKLKYYDNILQNIAVERQRWNINVDTPRYKNIVKIVRNLIKNEANRIINRIVKLYSPEEIVYEKLDFRHLRNWSKQMQRIMRHFGMNVIKNKLASIEELYGIKVTKINPAYTSKTCNACGYVDARNRNGEEFECLYCGHTGNADVNASRNTSLRSSDKEIKDWQSPNKVLEILCKRFLGKESQKRDFERHKVSKRRYSSASELLESNRYFAKYFANSSQRRVVE